MAEETMPTWTEATFIGVCQMLRKDLSEHDARVLWQKMLTTDYTTSGKIAGLGEEVLRVRLDRLQQLAWLPEDVEVVKVLSPPARGGYPLEWMATGSAADDHALYLHVRHRFCVRAPVGTVLMFTHLEMFLERYRDLTEKGR